jgi:hypothetical protein
MNAAMIQRQNRPVSSVQAGVNGLLAEKTRTLTGFSAELEQGGSAMFAGGDFRSGQTWRRTKRLDHSDRCHSIEAAPLR